MAEKSWTDRFDPLYFPLFTAIPVGVWLTGKDGPFQGVEISLYIITTLFLFFSGSVETSSDERKHRILGYLYMVSGLFLAGAGLYRWLN
ncbi:hypothetical protein [Halobacillus sp. KGW1]|uniref:hypothetical protein n=1 Tax=Halobacillus sp. KGW1 TaxID=1793726 RepID=UPI000785F90C|nr:hypothetical protein [Halobacillus sp. KGW1]